ncbi:MAG: hypothetical protein MJ089_00825 [Ruminococcus sp.]|nr:hypothetical protein [Ruminococcus sp.]
MNEIEKIARAEMYLEKLANGINPLTGEQVSENDIVSNVRISRCMFYVADILKQIVYNKGKLKIEMPDRIPFTVTQEQLSNFEYSDSPINISEIAKRINMLVNPIYVDELKRTVISEWLVNVGVLYNLVVHNKSRKSPTDYGRELGVITEERTGQYGTYEAVLYNRNAQKFIIDNIYAVIQFNNQKSCPSDKEEAINS